MKIIGGNLKKRNFFMPEGIRPTQNIVRKAVFDLIGHDLTDITFLDLFAGSGAIGIEAASRGAKEVYLVEKDPKVLQILEENITRLSPGTYGENAPILEVLNEDAYVAIKIFKEENKVFDVIFADPPYVADLAKKTLKTISGHDILHANSLLLIQHDEKEILPKQAGRIILFKEKRYGKTHLSIYKVGEENR